MSSPRASILAVALVALVLLPAVLLACPLCKDALEEPGGVPNQVGRGFYYSILLMMSAPFLLVGGLLLKIRLSRRRARSGGDATPTLVPAPPEARS